MMCLLTFLSVLKLCFTLINLVGTDNCKCIKLISFYHNIV